MAGTTDQPADQARDTTQAGGTAKDRRTLQPRDTAPAPERWSGPDAATGDRAQLHRRAERLDPRHPSSAYNPDGSRKPPVPDPFSGELPLPSERGADTDQTRLAEDDPRVGADGSWEWKGRTLTPDQARIADEALARCLAAEGRDADGRYGDRGLTPAMRRIEAQLEHGHLVEGTEEFALKSPDRFKEKYSKLVSDEPDSDPKEIASRINDGVRYTFIIGDEYYSSGVMDICSALTAAGFELYERKNAWADEAKAYQGVNSSWMDSAHAQIFEVQLHTTESWRAKQESHRAYEVVEAPSSTQSQREAAAARQADIFSAVPVPPNTADISSYRKEGW